MVESPACLIGRRCLRDRIRQNRSPRLEPDLPNGCRLGDGAITACGDELGEFAFIVMTAPESGFSETEVTCDGEGIEVTASAIRTMSARHCTVCDSTLLDYLAQNCGHSYYDAGQAPPLPRHHRSLLRRHGRGYGDLVTGPGSAPGPVLTPLGPRILRPVLVGVRTVPEAVAGERWLRLGLTGVAVVAAVAAAAAISMSIADPLGVLTGYVDRSVIPLREPPLHRL